eukprot:TRINITY_DN26172_c0_g1_i1.p1 TRINITY_DN26172_c0_g1~~TRINITY_DN26172_c0_g1_i1.p1  ORF type:complete len:433 (+),score=39.52 TRINITY_DN26172_c0_g1_i1:88-1386(+)
MAAQGVRYFPVTATAQAMPIQVQRAPIGMPAIAQNVVSSSGANQVMMPLSQIDPRSKMQKETAFLEALASCRFADAKKILESPGVAIDPCCVRRGCPKKHCPVTESPSRYVHPALTVAMMAGMEDFAHYIRCDVEKINAWMAREGEVCDIVALLIEKGADVNATGEEVQDCESAGCPEVHGKTPLCAAVQRGSPALVRMLLDAKADPNHTMSYDAAAYGPDKNNPFGPGILKPESWLGEITNGSVGKKDAKDPRNAHAAEILKLLRDAEESKSPLNSDLPPTKPCATGIMPTSTSAQPDVQPQGSVQAKSPQIITGTVSAVPASQPISPKYAQPATIRAQPAQPAIRPLSTQSTSSLAVTHGFAQPQTYVQPQFAQQQVLARPGVHMQPQVYARPQMAIPQQTIPQGYAPAYALPQYGQAFSSAFAQHPRTM